MAALTEEQLREIFVDCALESGVSSYNDTRLNADGEYCGYLTQCIWKGIFLEAYKLGVR